MIVKVQNASISTYSDNGEFFSCYSWFVTPDIQLRKCRQFANATDISVNGSHWGSVGNACLVDERTASNGK